ncbi:hypothetical protein TSH100_06315 [Azospirillum sp. TSH100]|uniref:hypothetical protein n=1 Tax=Azospirillum sp. TSH100 TaxID=652764 RepID=UPI000D618AFE|nr:hypothetical protein [Azospirillum sp. TSH100]PWC88826.1 hypothetical protein TSH100_06315 [Azospirillum sp. TSH100]QCG86769.1 hypothetical protein E6C72_02870 [Azospirillum sp. TSH100]
MVGHNALFDRDVFLKLAACDLFDETIGVLGIARSYRLPSATVSGARGMLRRWQPAAAVQDAFLERLRVLQEKVEVIPEAWFMECGSDPRFNAMIAPGLNIDVGEAQLTIITLSRPDPNLLISGDKRFVAGMASNFPEDFAILRGSLICFEDCLKAVVQHHGLEAIRVRLVAARGCDGTLKNALQSDCAATQIEFLEALESFNPLRQFST